MQISSTLDFDVDRATLIDRFRDPQKLERVLARQGVQTRRVADDPCLEWECATVWRDAPRDFTLRQQETVPHETIVMTVTSKLADVEIKHDFYDLPDDQSRVMTEVQVQAHSVMVRLALQSLRLVRGRAEGMVTRLVRAIGRG